MNESQWAFLTSTRFWAMFITAGSIYLEAKGIIGVAETIFVATILTGFTVVRTVDRIGDKKVEAAEATTE